MMDLTKVADDVSNIHTDVSTIYLFGSELYCGWCLESFTCPVRLKIHCHIEHLATCSCGERYRDKETLCKHVAQSGCCLPPPFRWSHFVKLPCSEVSDVCSTSNTVDETTTGLDRNIQKRRTVREKQTVNKESYLQKCKQRKFTCLLCPFQCSCPSQFECHTQKKHRNVHKSMTLNSGHEMSEKNDDSTAVENDDAVSKSRVALQDTVADKFGHTSSSAATSNVSEKLCCKKHRSDDIPLIANCFSSSLDGKLLCCDLCGDEFGEWKEAAVHVYGSHLFYLEQWRDAHIDSDNKLRLKKDSYDEQSAGTGSAADDQLKQSGAEVAKSDNSVRNENILKHSSINSEHSISNTSVNPTTVHLSFDECKMIASSLCKTFKCCDSEPELEISQSKKVDTHNSTVKIVDEKLPTASNSKPVNAGSSDTAAAMQLSSHKCKFCHRIYSTKSNCQRHEAICCRILLNSKSRDSTVRKIDGEGIFYCSLCGFSDTDQKIVNEHLKKPHTVSKKGLDMKTPPGHDYVGSMKLATGSFQCALCGQHSHCRSRMLMHLHKHSSPVAPPKGMHATHQPESRAVQMKQSTKQQSSKFYSSSGARSCPKCFLSFSSVSKYLSHRAVCRAIRHRETVQPCENVQRHGNVCKYSYLFNFCKQTPAGQWKCKLCEHYSGHRGDLYKHIRTKHSKLQNTKLERQLCFRKADGLWQCGLCKCSFTCHNDVHKHIGTKHSAEFK